MENKMVEYIIGIVVSILMVAFLLPVALTALTEASLPTDLDENVASMITTVIPLMAVLGIVIGFIAWFKKQQ